ncbi:MAG TPA: 1-acyl-sn-glycerol-3-phosphate acyltransferase [Pyrinomonadaceae bacterium]|jgi:glycerol-3-phosphate O-acyltransferase
MPEPSTTLPNWAVALLVVLSSWAVAENMLKPLVRWFMRRRVNRVLEEINTRLRIQIQPFKLTKREVLIDRLLYDPQVQEAAEAHALEHQLPREAVMQRVERYAREIVPAFNAYVYFRFGYWLARRAARSLYRVRLGYTDEAGLAAVNPQSTVVFFMNHRSNMDYILISFLAAERTALSYAVGEWARIWPLQTLIRAMGAYFVRRDSRDALYRKVLERYVHMATTAGVTQAVYPEGGLTRDGRLRPPKLGLLDYMLRSFDPAGERDLVFVPVGINYDRVLEDRSQLRELDKTAERKSKASVVLGTLAFIFRNLRLMARNRWRRFGYACVNFGTPVSLKAYLAARQLDFRPLEKEARFARVEELARELMHSIAAVIPAVPVPLLATVFVNHPARTWSELELKTEVLELMRRLESRGAHIYIPRRDQDYAVTVGLRMLTLRRLVVQTDGLYAVQPEELPLLNYYANSIAEQQVGSRKAEG